MPLPETIISFTGEQLERIDATLDPQLVAWAKDIGMGAPPVVQNLARIAGRKSIIDSRIHEQDFRSAVIAGQNLELPSKELGYKAPIHAAGLAAGLAMKTTLLMRWYDLDAGDFAAPADLFWVMSDPRSEPLDRSVGSLPKELGLVDFTMHKLFIKTMFAAEDAVRSAGLAALDQFLQDRPAV